jgi:hypothetical protein
MIRKLLTIPLILLAACSPAAATAAPQVVRVYASSSAQTWLAELYDCAGSGPAVIVVAAGPASADMLLRIGDPELPAGRAYQIATEEILVVVHPQAGVGALSADQVRLLFSGQAANWKDVGGNDLPVQVWVYGSGEDVQQVFEQAVMLGEPVSSLARLAVSAQDMSDSVGLNPGSVGILTRHWKAGNTREAFLAASAPALAITPSEPQGAVEGLIACLQARSLAPPNLLGYKRPV